MSYQTTELKRCRKILKQKELKKKCKEIQFKRLAKVSETRSKSVVLNNKSAVCHICKQVMSGPHIKCYSDHSEDFLKEDTALAIYYAIHDGRRTSSKTVYITGFTIYDAAGQLCPLSLINEGARVYLSGHIMRRSDKQDGCVAVKDIGPLISWSIKLQKTLVISLKTQYELGTPSKDYVPVFKEHPPTQSKKNKFVKMAVKTDNSKSLCGAFKKKTVSRSLKGDIETEHQTKAVTTPLVRKSFETLFTRQLQQNYTYLPFDQKSCGVCAACQLPDCGECRACRAMPKFGGDGGERKNCIKKQCLNISSDDDDNDSDENDLMHSNKHLNFKVPAEFNGFEYAKIIWPKEPSHIGDDEIFYKSANVNGVEVLEGDFVILEPRYQNVPSLIARVAYIWSVINRPKYGYFHAEIFFRSHDTVLGGLGHPREIFLSDTCCDEVPLPCILRKADVTFKDVQSNWFEAGEKPVTKDDWDDDGKTYYYQKFYERFTGRFEDIPDVSNISTKLMNIAKKLNIYCVSCMRKDIRDGKILPVLGKAVDYDPKSSEREKCKVTIEPDRLEFATVAWRGEILEKGKGVFLKPGTFRIHKDLFHEDKPKRKKSWKVDSNCYTEYFRKTGKNLTGSNYTTAKPFDIGYIVAVCAKPLIGDVVIPPQQIYFKVCRLYRPEQTFSRFPQNEDLNVVYWSDEIYDVPASNIVGLCQLFYADNIPANESSDDWIEKDTRKFYFSSAYNKNTREFEAVPEHAKHISFDLHEEQQHYLPKMRKNKIENEDSFNKEPRPLRTLDLFAGAGGLAEGLRRAGLADCRWAVDNFSAATDTYASNHERCCVYCEDANSLLNAILAGHHRSSTGQFLPAKGEVELICAGPPCQGFSMMNRFSSEEGSKLKNSLIATMLSYVDYYRPKYLIFENVRNLAACMNGMVLKAMMRVLVDMGYQCRFGVLQAGNFGVPQSRRRLILLAAAPGLTLPGFPEPSHVFNKRACSLDIMIDGKLFFTNTKWYQSAPLRTCTVYDAMFDLPPIESGADELEIIYDWKPYTHYQRLMRQGSPPKILDHVCNKVTPLSQARIERIPTIPGSDWRELPNIRVVLSNGRKTKILDYKYNVKKRAKSKWRKKYVPDGGVRGVCPCAEGEACSRAARQTNTLIPWNLAHTADKHSNWPGLYGRVSWYGYCSTTLTDPDPMHTQGRVLHPDQHRVLSVRECARSQGFQDKYRFMGSIKEKYRLIGNAVPPPLAEALGREIKKAIEKDDQKRVKI